MIDEEISRIVRESQRFADEILRKDIDMLHRMAKELLKYETIDAKDLEKIMNGETLTRALNGASSPKKPRRRYSKRRSPKNTATKQPNSGKSINTRKSKSAIDRKTEEVKT